MEISLRDRVASTIDELMKHSPDAKIVMRCLACQNIFLPKEIHIMKMPIRLKDGHKTFLTAELCPVCFPNPEAYIADPNLDSSEFITLTREQFFLTRQYERAGLIPPDFTGKSNLLIS
jgi:hypothetical protein